MKTCWQVLGIEATTDTDAIRQAYLALLPSFHPETDPQGFKLLREAYENALQGTTSPAITMVEEDPDTPWVNYLREILGDLLADGERRFQPQAWQEFIQQINKLSITQAEKARWLLCDIAMQTFPVSYSCMNLLSQRLSWEQRDCNGEIDRERLDNFLFYVERGDLFSYSQLMHLSPVAQNQTITFYDALDASFFDHPHYFAQLMALHGAWVIPDDLRFQRRLLRWFSSLRQGIAELLPVALAWQEAEPDSQQTPGYYHLAQRVFCGEGDSLLPELYAQWWEHPSTQLDDLLLRWCRQHRPDFFPLLVMAVEAREQVDIDGEPLLYIPGSSARTCLLWAEALHSGALSPLSESFIARRLNYGAPAMSEAHSQHPYWLLYQVADSLACAEDPSAALLQRLVTKLDAPDICPLEALIIRGLLGRAAAIDTPCEAVVADEEPVTTVTSPSTEESGGGFGLWQVIKIILFIGVVGHVLRQFMH
ncbi:J domain-containing protein [Salmonella enterica subsp. enterica serovar Kedougou]|uniref:J domain-containing protein n=3 Tax=Salmonella enterica TaxID=28901 RepID=A0A742RET7_SALER|nr:J domain-containing protein [Salmonella enterica]EBW8249064.1 J domain-containing protein [Salmonella enterica subsp. enterica serovar Typhimurium]ECC3406400.1 J domain-containing protein [Salmonella enterica subsp. enterica]MCL9530985.1 J domain-containing protein [Salmonella enterica subsp. enterica serovar Enteritidis]EAA3092969.1 J domain-containing protein [Salmonella enterica subsp. enterica serovar Kedougou]EAA3683132.1 J domain-containing protein [Salmonella enterica subsp. enterica